MENPELNLLVLRSTDLEKSVGFYGLLGLVFDEEKHGNGPIHYSAQLGQLVLELYPLGKRNPTTDTRLGFLVSSVDECLNQLEPDSIVEPAEDTGRGRLAIVKDPDGHTIELFQSA
ncbi:MAG: VOC family protein [Candidatus Saccharimonadales bacterium]